MLYMIFQYPRILIGFEAILEIMLFANVKVNLHFKNTVSPKFCIDPFLSEYISTLSILDIYYVMVTIKNILKKGYTIGI